ncbi:hypothetical protein Moror_9402 [Moniliophthora roreri MCA 2997]|uniref:Uncharacterized protein n=1 Tax=Moniliophthora roreri (strain MCA 2997) TaxID=1381753 RepID=V2Y308_MONRO|nr:hypothetical protein Moror_9402 [Moniliophthora roreri MCA 2997]
MSQLLELKFHFPRITSWDFAFGDEVESWGDLRGDIVEVKGNGLYIKVWDGDEPEIHYISWLARKIWQVGNLVRHSVHGWNGAVVSFYRENHETTVHVMVENEGQEYNVEMISDANLLV